MQLLPLLFSAMLCTREIVCPKIDMAKLYKITQTPATGTPSDIDQKIPGINVAYCNNDQIIVITFNTPNDQLTQTVNLTIAAAEGVKPNLLTIKTYEDIEKLITVNTDKTAVNVALGVNTPEGKIVLVYNGEVDVKMTSPEAEVATEQKYLLKSPYFINQTAPLATTATNADFKLSNSSAYDYYLCAFYQTMQYLSSFFWRISISDDCLRELSKIYCAERTRNEMSKACINATKATPCTPVLNIIDCEKLSASGKFSFEQCIKPTSYVQKDKLTLSITNAIAISTIFELVDLSCSDDDYFYSFVKSFVEVKTELTLQDTCAIMYNIIEAYCETSTCKTTYLECVNDLGINVKTLYTPSIESDSTLKSCLNRHMSSFSFNVTADTEVKAETTVEEETVEETQESETSESSKKKTENKGMSTTKKVVIVSVVVVLVVSATVGAVMAFA